MILFLHGLESGPSGTKARWLASRYPTVTPQLDTSSLAAALAGARAAVAEVRPSVIVGSSFGGGLAVALLAEGVWRGPTVLIAPAQGKLGVPATLPPGVPVTVLHGEHDDVIPLADSLELTAGAGPEVHLVVVPGGDHRLNVVLGDGQLAAAIARVGGPH